MEGSMGTTRMAFLAPVTTHVFNPVTRLFAGVMPGFGIVTHLGRHTGRRYRTPVLVSRRGNDYVVALWYGSDVQWVTNVRAAGGCDLQVRGHDVRIVDPELVIDPSRRFLPMPLRLAGRFIRVTEFLRMPVRGPVSTRSG